MAKLDYNEDDIQFVVEITGETPKKAEEHILSVYKDLEDDTACIFDVLDIIEIEHRSKKDKIKVVARAEKADGDKKKVAKPKKVVAEKKEVYDLIVDALVEKYTEDNVKRKIDNKLILLRVGTKTIKIDLVDTKKIKFED